MTIRANRGTGPGPIAADGCPVALYALLPPAGEPEIVHAAIPPGASVLELGCGTGRILRRLAELGHPTLGVDESPEMLAHADGLDTVCSPIQTLNLGRSFDTVLLASMLINTPDPASCSALLDSARRHIVRGGSLVVQRHPPQWFDTLAPASAERDGIRYTIAEVHRNGPLLSATVEYQADKQRWTHTFTARRLSNEELITAVHSAGFGSVRWLTEDRSWLAVPAT